MKGMVLAEQGHFVNVIPPIDITGGVAGDRFKMDNYQHASITVAIGVSAAAFTAIVVKECDAATAGTATAIPFTYYEETTALGDTVGAKQVATSAGITPSANDNIFYRIELDAQELSDGFNWVEVELTNGANSVIASVSAELTGARYQPGATAIA